jgi:hypothetical protein
MFCSSTHATSAEAGMGKVFSIVTFMQSSFSGC